MTRLMYTPGQRSWLNFNGRRRAAEWRRFFEAMLLSDAKTEVWISPRCGASVDSRGPHTTELRSTLGATIDGRTPDGRLYRWAAHGWTLMVSPSTRDFEGDVPPLALIDRTKIAGVLREVADAIDCTGVVTA